MKLFITILLICVCVSMAVAQKKSRKNTVLATVLSNLSTPEICGNPEWAEKGIYTGTVIKREFDESEINLSGFVLKDAKDRRTFINIDDDHVSGLASAARKELSDFLLKGKRVKVFVYRCGRILYAYKIQSI